MAAPATSSFSSHRHHASPLSIDLSTIPALSQPHPPSNTLLITQLNSPTIFHPASLATIRQHITTLHPLHSFSPLKSLRRIICSFYSTEAAVAIRQHLDGLSLLGNVRARVYFGEPTPIGEQKRYLDRPDAGRLFFISPPPSPPVGWEIRDEGPPNKDVIARDLADALGKLRGKMHDGEGFADELATEHEEQVQTDGEDSTKTEPTLNRKPPLSITAPSDHPSDGPATTSPSKASPVSGTHSAKNRSRSSTVIYDPETHGDSPALPAVTVEDTTLDPLENEEGGVLRTMTDEIEKKIMAHTSRPPVELMGSA